LDRAFGGWVIQGTAAGLIRRSIDGEIKFQIRSHLALETSPPRHPSAVPGISNAKIVSGDPLVALSRVSFSYPLPGGGSRSALRDVSLDRPGFEEAVRALFAGDRQRFDENVAIWSADVRDHARKLTATAF